MKFKGKITVWLKESIFDPQGAAVKGSLETLGFHEVSQVRMGKHIEITLEASGMEEAQNILDDMSKRLLANPVTEKYRVEVEEENDR